MFYLFLCTLCFILNPVFANASHHSHSPKKQHAHVHGVGQLNIGVEGKKVQIELEVPAHDILGFEHSPQSDREKKFYRRAFFKLNKSNGLFVFNETAQCRPQNTPKVQGPKDHATQASEHSEFQLHYEFHCENPTELKELKVNHFVQFNKMKELKVQIITPSAQLSDTLTRRKTKLSLIKE